MTEVWISGFDKNLEGLEDNTDIIKEESKHNYNEDVNIKDKIDILEIIKKNIINENSRHLMIISEGNYTNATLKYLLKQLKLKHIELIISK